MKFVSRSQWGARDTSGALTRINLPVSNIYIHHTESPSGPDPAAIWRGVQAYHMNSRGYADIAYEAGIATDGTVYEGRVTWAVGAHTLNHNRDGHAICFIGNYQLDPPTDAQINAARELIADWQAKGICVANPTILGHRDVFATACPGDAAYAQLDRIRQPWAPAPAPSTQEDEMAYVSKVWSKNRPQNLIGVYYDPAAKQLVSSGRILTLGGRDAATWVQQYACFVMPIDDFRGIVTDPNKPDDGFIIVTGSLKTLPYRVAP